MTNQPMYWRALTGVVHTLYWGHTSTMQAYGWNLSCTSTRIPYKDGTRALDLIPTCLVCVWLWERT